MLLHCEFPEALIFAESTGRTLATISSSRKIFRPAELVILPLISNFSGREHPKIRIAVTQKVIYVSLLISAFLIKGLKLIKSTVWKYTGTKIIILYFWPQFE